MPQASNHHRADRRTRHSAPQASSSIWRWLPYPWWWCSCSSWCGCSGVRCSPRSSDAARNRGAAGAGRAALTLVALVSTPAILLGQALLVTQSHDEAHNRVYGEFLGPGIVYSLNYERTLTGPISFRVGVSGWPQSGFQYALGFGMGMLRLGRGDHMVLVGLGGGVASFVDVDVLDRTGVVGGYAVGMVAYQYQPNLKGIFIRFSYTPVATTEAIVPLWGGLALGWAF